MTVTQMELAEYVGAQSGDDFVGSCLQQATEMVTDHLLHGGLNLDTYPIPTEVQDRAVLEVGSELYHRRNAPNGVAQFATMDGAPIRVARDPMVAARPILAPYLAGGFG